MTGDPRVLAPLQQALIESDNGNTQSIIVSAWRSETGRDAPYAIIDAEIRAWTPPTAEPSLDDLAFGLSIKFASLEQRVAEIERGYRHHDQQIGICLDGNSDLTNRINDEEAVNRRQWTDILELRSRVTELERADTHEPECTRCGGTGHPRENCTLEQPAPDDPVCAREGCGHGKSQHFAASRLPRPCRAIVKTYHDGRSDEFCSCSDFLPAPQPAPDLDPVRVEEPNIESALKALGYAYQLLPRKHREYDAGAGGHMRDVFRRLTGITHEDAMSNEERIHNELMRLGEGVDRDWR